MADLRDDPVLTARDLIAERFPQARAAFLAGSAMSSRRTATSDLDVVVVVPDDDAHAPFRETTSSRGWVVELFVHTTASLRHYRTVEREAHRPVLDLMCAEGVPLLGLDTEPVAAAARASLAAGFAVSPAEWERRRYVLTDLLDDLEAAGDDPVAGPGTDSELAFVAARLLEETAHLALLRRGGFAHTGKAAARDLAGRDPDLLARLVTAHRAAVGGSPAALSAVVDGVLDEAGGRLREGYRARGAVPVAEGPPAGAGEDGDA